MSTQWATLTDTPSPLPLEIYNYILQFVSIVQLGEDRWFDEQRLTTRITALHNLRLLLFGSRTWQGLKFYITVKASPNLMCTKIQHWGRCLKTNTALSFASCCICLLTCCLLTCPLLLYFPYAIVGVALSMIMVIVCIL